jgi:hypothetical protein
LLAGTVQGGSGTVGWSTAEVAAVRYGQADKFTYSHRDKKRMTVAATEMKTYTVAQQQ